MDPDLAQHLSDLKDAFPHQKVGDRQVALYMRQLSDLPSDVLGVVVQEMIRTREFFPTISAIRAAAAERMLALPGEAEALAQIEERMRWARLSEADRDEAPVVHPLVREALDHVGGYPAFRGDEPSIARGQFGRLFRELRVRRLHDAQVGTLALERGARAVRWPSG